MLAKRLQALLVFKQHEQEGISKREVAERTGVDPNSVQTWRSAYIQGGIDGLLAHGRVGFKPSMIEPHQEVELRAKLHDPQNGLRGYVELVAWFNAHFGTEIKYKTLNQYVKRHYKASSKTARKSHVRKDKEALEAFKKTSVLSARR